MRSTLLWIVLIIAVLLLVDNLIPDKAPHERETSWYTKSRPVNDDEFDSTFCPHCDKRLWVNCEKNPPIDTDKYHVARVICLKHGLIDRVLVYGEWKEK